MNKEQYITKLTKIWYELVSLDHHMDIDCYWDIYQTWSFGKGPSYSVQHYGRIHKIVYNVFNTYGEAEQFLLDTLTHAIKSEEQWAGKVRCETDFYDDEDQEKAKDILGIIRKYTDGK